MVKSNGSKYWQSYFEEKAQNEKDIYKRVGFVSKENTDLVRETIRNIIGSPKDLKIIDAGCGDGMVLSHLTESNEVWGIDFSYNMLTLAKEQGLHPVCCDMSLLPFKENSLDIAVSVEAVTLLPNPIKVIEDISDCIKPGGSIVLSVLNKKSIVRFFAGWLYRILGRAKLPNTVSLPELEDHLSNKNCTIKDIVFIYWLPFMYLRSSGFGLTSLKLLLANNIIIKASKDL